MAFLTTPSKISGFLAINNSYTKRIIPIRISKWSKIAQEKVMIARRLIEQ
jgi:hypothetical protein